MANFDSLVDDSLRIMNIKIGKKTQIDSIHVEIKRHFEVLIYNVVSVAIMVALTNNAKKITPAYIEESKQYILSKCSSNKSKKQSGGTSMTSDYYGYPHSAYAPSHGGEENISDVNYQTGVIRSSIDSTFKMQGGKNKSKTQNGGMSMTSDYYGHPHSAYAPSHGSEENVSDINFQTNTIRQSIDSTFKMQGGGGKSLIHFVSTNKNVKSNVREILSQNSMSISRQAMDALLHVIEIHIHCVLSDMKKVSPITLSKVEKIFKLTTNSIFL
jgi:hypothetical protein